MNVPEIPPADQSYPGNEPLERLTKLILDEFATNPLSLVTEDGTDWETALATFDGGETLVLIPQSLE
jgi:hypothetical protein